MDCAGEKVGDESFLLISGDRFFPNSNGEPAARRLISQYDILETDLIGLKSTSGPDICRFGAATGEWKSRDVLFITHFKEKPSQDYAEEFLRVSNSDDRPFCAFFGQFILQPGIFPILESMIRENSRENGEIQPTDALDRLRQHSQVYGYVLPTASNDLGTQSR